MLKRAVQPAGCRGIVHPGMLDADVIGHQIDHQLHAARVQRIG